MVLILVKAYRRCNKNCGTVSKRGNHMVRQEARMWFGPMKALPMTSQSLTRSCLLKDLLTTFEHSQPLNRLHLLKDLPPLNIMALKTMLLPCEFLGNIFKAYANYALNYIFNTWSPAAWWSQSDEWDLSFSFHCFVGGCFQHEVWNSIFTDIQFSVSLFYNSRVQETPHSFISLNQFYSSLGPLSPRWW